MRRLLVVVALLPLLIAACGPKEKPAPPTPSPQEIIQRCSTAMGNLNYFHFGLEQSSGSPIAMGLKMLSASGDIARPDKLKLDISATMGNTAMEVKIITVGKTTYMTNPLSGKWEPLPTVFNAVRFFDPDTGIKAIIGGISSPMRLADEEISGVACYHVKGSIDSGQLRPITCGAAIGGTSVDTEVWIGKKDFLLRQIRLRGQITKGEQADITRTMKLSKFDQAVSIKLPQ